MTGRIMMGVKPCRTELGRFVRSQRGNLGLSQKKVAELADISPEDLSMIETGRRDAILSKTAEGLSRVLNLDFSKPAGFIWEKERESQTTLGRTIRRRRQEIGISQNQLAKKVGCTRAHISLIEIGCKVKLCESEIIAKLAKALGFKTGELESLRLGRRVYKTKKRETALGCSLTQRREELGFSITKLAKEAGVSISWLYRIEHGLAKPSPRFLAKITAVFDSANRASKP